MKQIFFFLEFICFLYDPTTNIGNLISGSYAFSKPTLYIWSSWFPNHWSLTWRILSITLLACEMSTTVQYFEHFFGTAFLWDWNENWPFPVCGHCWVFQICWYIECSTLTASSFRIFNSSSVISSPWLALFIIMLPKAPSLHTPGYLAVSGWPHHCG